MKSALSHLECASCGATFSADEIQTVCRRCGKALLAKYDLESLRKLDRDEVARRPGRMWRWRELLPVRRDDRIVTLGEGQTPLLRIARIGRRHGTETLFVKEEGGNPTGSFKARGFSAAVSRAVELGITHVAAPSAGNAGAALAAYGAAAGVSTAVFIPQDAPRINKVETAVCGAAVYLVRGLISDAGKIVRELASSGVWFDFSTMKEPYRVEGKKTMGFEIAEHFHWELPDAILYPTGGGTGLIGMWKAFDELEALGWIGPARPRMISVQASGCAPVVRAFEEGKKTAEFWEGATTAASGLRVPYPFADSLILKDIDASRGTAVAVSDDEMLKAMRELASQEGLFFSPEGASTYAAYKRLAETGFLEPQDRVVLFNTGAGLKSPEWVPVDLPVIDPGHVPAIRTS